MKCSFMTFSTPELTLRENLDLARRLEYDGIEPRIAAGHRHGLELDAPAGVRAAARAMAADMGVAYACVATSCRYADPSEGGHQIGDTRRAIDLAADIGAPCIRVFGGEFPADVYRASAVGKVAAALGAVADHAAQRGVQVCLETHDAWCRPDDVAAVMRAVDHPAIGVNWDIMHPIRAGGATMDSAFDTLRPWVCHTHVHDGGPSPTDGLLPIGEGDIDHARAIQLLAAAGYAGFLSGEWIDWEPYEVHLPRELARLRALLAEV